MAGNPLYAFLLHNVERILKQKNLTSIYAVQFTIRLASKIIYHLLFLSFMVLLTSRTRRFIIRKYYAILRVSRPKELSLEKPSYLPRITCFRINLYTATVFRVNCIAFLERRFNSEFDVFRNMTLQKYGKMYASLRSKSDTIYTA